MTREEILINKAYEHCKQLLDEAVSKYSKVETDLFAAHVENAKAGNTAYFTDYVSDVETESQMIQTVLAKDAVLTPFRAKCLQARSKWKFEITHSNLEDRKVRDDIWDRIRTDYWPTI